MRTVFLVIFFIMSSSAISEDFDFYIMTDSCKSLVSAPQIGIENPVRLADGDMYDMKCKRNNKKVECQISTQDGSLFDGKEYKINSYDVFIDSPPHLFLKAENGGEMININTNDFGAVIDSRMPDTRIHATKLCHAVFMTSDQMKAMKQSKSAKK